MVACVLHIVEGSIFLSTTAANGSIGMATQLAVFHLSQICATVMYGAAILAGIGEWMPDLSRLGRFTLLFPQFSLLIISAIGAINAVFLQHYADGVPRPWPFIFCDQLPRMTMFIWYGAAVFARVRD